MDWLETAGSAVGLVGGLVGLASGARAIWKEARARSDIAAARIRLTREWDNGPVLVVRVAYEGREAHTDYLARLQLLADSPGDLTAASFKREGAHGRWIPTPSWFLTGSKSAVAMIREDASDDGFATFVIAGLFEADAQRIRIAVDIQDDGRGRSVAKRVFDVALPEH